MTLRLQIYRFDIRLAFGPRRELLPPFLGSTLRGTFGATFRRLVCETGADKCTDNSTDCALIHDCPYARVFETRAPADALAERRRRYKDAARPYVIAVPARYDGAPELMMGLVLIGGAVRLLPHFVHVLTELGRIGIGMARVPYRLRAVLDHAGAVLFDCESGWCENSVRALGLEDFIGAGDANVDRITLDFLTPLRLKKYGGYLESGERVDFRLIIESLLQRLGAISFFHCGGEWVPDESLREAAQRIAVTDNRLELQRLARYSNRQHRRLPMDGLVGTLTCEGELAPFLPALRLGELVHLGNGADLGLGRYRLAGCGADAGVEVGG